MVCHREAVAAGASRTAIRHRCTGVHGSDAVHAGSRKSFTGAGEVHVFERARLAQAQADTSHARKARAEMHEGLVLLGRSLHSRKESLLEDSVQAPTVVRSDISTVYTVHLDYVLILFHMKTGQSKALARPSFSLFIMDYLRRAPRLAARKFCHDDLLLDEDAVAQADRAVHPRGKIEVVSCHHRCDTGRPY